MVKKLLALFLVVLMSIDNLAAVVSDNDGSAFITKAEFDSLKNDFQSQIDQYNTSIDSKIDGAIASYLAGITVGTQTTLNNNYNKILNTKELRWISDTNYQHADRCGAVARIEEHRETYLCGDVVWRAKYTKAKRVAEGYWTWEDTYMCNQASDGNSVVYVENQKEIEPTFTASNWYKFAVFCGYYQATDTTYELASRTPQPRYDNLSLENPSFTNYYQNKGDLNGGNIRIAEDRFNSGSRRMIYNTVNYVCETIKTHDYLTLAPVSSKNTYYYWQNCKSKVSHVGWFDIHYIPTSTETNYEYELENNTSDFTITTNGTTYTYKAIVFKPFANWTGTIQIQSLGEGAIPWTKQKIAQNKLRYTVINNATGEDREINYGILLTKSTDDGKMSFSVHANVAGKLKAYVGNGAIANLGTASSTNIKSFDIGTTAKKITIDVKKNDNIRIVFLPTDTSVYGTLTFDSDIILEKTNQD